MNLTDLIPAPCRILAVALLVVAVFGFGFIKGISHESSKNDIVEANRVKSENAAIFKRVNDNKALTAKYEATNKSITENKNAEISKIRADVAAFSSRMRKPSFCGGPAPAPETSGPGSGDVGNPAPGVVPAAVAENIRALITKTEEVAATGRACQAFVRDNGLSP